MFALAGYFVTSMIQKNRTPSNPMGSKNETKTAHYLKKELESDFR